MFLSFDVLPTMSETFNYVGFTRERTSLPSNSWSNPYAWVASILSAPNKNIV